MDILDGKCLHYVQTWCKEKCPKYFSFPQVNSTDENIFIPNKSSNLVIFINIYH